MDFKVAKVILLFSLIAFCFRCSYAQHDTPASVFYKMQYAIRSTYTCSFNLKTIESHKDKTLSSEFVVKINSSPYKVFVYCVTPNPGAKALLQEGVNENKAVVHPNSFPYFNLSLSPYHSLLRKNHHFTMWEMGFNYIADLFDGYIKKDSLMFMHSLSLLPDTQFNKGPCLRLTITPPSYFFADYVVQPGENITTISKKLLLNDNMILENNPQLDGMNDVKAGDKIKVPNVFAKKIILYLDKQNFLPVVQEMYDNDGLFIRVEMSGLVRNPKFDVNEFSKEKL